MPLSLGDTLFEYRITRPLGQGAFGMVYLAKDTLLDRPVAIKELTSAAQADPIAFQRFLQEARAAGSLNHPHKALDLLDEACARARIPTISKPTDKMVGLVVTARTVAEVLGEWKGISVDALLDAE
jgi:serine/threonine protein kinase